MSAAAKTSLAPAKAAPGSAARAVATSLLVAVLDHHRPLDALLETRDSAYAALPQRDRAFARALVGTALRRLGEIDKVLARLIERGLPRRAGPLSRHLQIAATQLLFMEVADHAAVSLALDAIDADRDARHFKGLANAVLRRITREREALRADADPPRDDTPDWLWARWSNTYGEATARAIAEAHLVEPSLDLSVKGDAGAWAEKLGATILPTGSLRLVPSGPVDELPGFAEGAWWVQDAAAGLAPRLAGNVAGRRVADLCAAPGGKTAALAAAGAKVTAVDIARQRLARLTANLARLSLTAETVAADLLAWKPADLFDAVLLDAPCTATGTIRRHPDVARLKKPEDIATLAALQARMIDHALGLLRPGGTLVYCTCSLEPEEGERHLARMRARADVALVPVTADEIGGLAEAVTADGAVRTLPSHLAAEDRRLSGLDGFFMMRLAKR